jgi:hypothetical protein
VDILPHLADEAIAATRKVTGFHIAEALVIAVKDSCPVRRSIPVLQQVFCNPVALDEDIFT